MVNNAFERWAGSKKLLLKLAHWLPSHADSGEAPLRAELFTVEQLINHGKNTAEQHKLGVKEGNNRLLARLDANEKILQVFNRTTLTVDKQRRVTPAAEWLLDNFYLIEEQIQMARRHLPRGYSRELPRLSNGASAGLPRVYDLALELIAHVDAQIDVEHLNAFIGAYQTVTPLNLGELWAVPIMLRLGLIENLRRITVQLKLDRQDRDTADYWADRLQAVAETDASNIIVVIADMARAKLPLSSAFVAEFCQRIARLDPAVHFARNWLEQRLADNGFSVEQRILTESQNQAADQVSISHTIASLRFIGATDWREFVEGLSLVNQTLCNDPARVFKTMDFMTRDRYRHSVEQIARYSKVPENDVAWKAVKLAENNSREKGPADRTAHVGFFLIDKGRQILESSAKVSWPWRALAERTIRKFPLTFYAGGMVAIMVPATIIIGRYARALDIHGGKLIFLTLAVLLCMSQIAVAVMNWLSTCLVQPRQLPRLDFSKGIAPDCRTMVVVPTMLDSATGIDRLLETVEIHYLANRDKNLYFSLLTDFRDAPAEKMPNDEVLLDQVSEGINLLNRKYASDRPNTFFLFHRPRKWNESEKVWMGYERKRGKLAEFNALLRGGALDCFSRIVGEMSLLAEIKFVITLDTDTQLPRDAARQLVGTIAHPLNRPQFNPDTGLVSEGYSILQPRVGVSLPSASRSWFVRLFAGDAGIDPYTRAVSDVYQDVFSEGSFIGKGIYDVDAFERAVHGRFPENTILSHDLIESLHARSALISDVELYEEHPSRYNADINRRHRWIRGDWQIAQWLLPRVPGPDARNIANPLSSLSQWKIFDNLRRSLVPAALTLLLLSGWTIMPQFGRAGSLLVLGIIVLPALLPVLAELLRKPGEWPWIMHLRTTGKSFARQLGQLALTLAFLPYDAFVSLDAISRTLVRLLFTRKRLLQWQTSSDAERNARTDLESFYATMWFPPVIAASALLVLLITQPAQLINAAPFLLLWLCAPAIAWWISQPIVRVQPELTDDQLTFLARGARRTWRFFEIFITERDNWLPPDNFQEHPKPVVASRTSPTNIGLALLANLTAYDFGYLPVGQLIDRTQKTFATLDRMERYRGHFYNWYDTRTLKPLLPNYISTVDSGNLAGHLFILGAGLTELCDAPILTKQTFSGLRDTLGLLREVGGSTPQMESVERALSNPPDDLSRAHALLERLAVEGPQLAASYGDQTEEVKWWAQAFERGCREHLEDLLFLAPWIPSLNALKNQLGAEGVERVRPSAGAEWEPEAPSPLTEQLERLEKIQTLREFAEVVESFGHTLAHLPAFAANGTGEDESELWRNDLFLAVQKAAERAGERIRMLEDLARRAGDFANMDITFLFDTVRELFTIGYNVTERRRDPSFYDLLASEARLGSYVAIAQGQVPQKHWFSLGRLLACTQGEPVLVSWSGSMFEYLMPLLVMPTYENTLIDHTYRTAVNAQIEYGRTRGTAWGISESGYNLTDAELNYQYRAFGIPGLGFKRGLAEDLVVAPYASVMALMVDPKAACENLERLAAEGRLGEYGFYEAVDFTPSRLPPNETSATIRSFMVHHQGMSLLSFAYLLLDRPMQRRFLAHPPFKASELLLQERVPKTITTLSSEDVEFADARGLLNEGEGVMRVFTTPHTPTPEVHLLSNGRYHVVISNSGGGYSRWNNLAITRWREDATRDCWGSFCYLRDVSSGEFWSMTYQPARELGRQYEAIFTQARAEFRQRHGPYESHVEISVSPEDDVELRRITLANHSNVPRTIELTTYAEVVLAPAAADAAHPAFGNLFVQTEFVPAHPALLCTRRARAEGERPPWMFHLVAVQGGNAGDVTYETDRAKFTGRGRNLNFPAAMHETGPLSNTAGSVLDPIVSLRRVITIPAQGSVKVEIIMGMADNREAALAQIEKYHNPRMTDRVLDLAWTHSQVSLRQIDATEADAQLYARMAGALVYANPAKRAASSVLTSNRRGQGGLWSYGVSGDAPIVLLRITDPQKMDLARRLVQAHAYWRLKGLAVELVIVNEDTSVYRQSLQDTIVGLISAGSEAQMIDKPGGIFVKRLEQIPAEDRVLLQSAARLILSDEKGTLDEQLQRREIRETEIPDLEPAPSRSRELPVSLPQRDLVFFNGLGGFTADGKEYIINLDADQSTNAPRKNPSPSKFSAWRQEKLGAVESRLSRNLLGESIERIQPSNPEKHSGNATPSTSMTPAPWVNVLANPRFGTLVSETGSAYTWLENSHEFRLTPWNNDPVTDISGEAFYIRDDETGEFWSPTPLPARGQTPYSVRHGFGYTVFDHIENGIASETWVYVAKDAPVKFTTVKLRNLSSRPRHISVFGYWEWVLSDLRSKSLLHVQTELDAETGALVARNRYNTEFTDRVAFVDVNYAGRGLTGDRREFIGRNGSLANPAALKKIRLSGKVGAGLDPCAALQVRLDLPAKNEREITFRLGAGRDLFEARTVIQRFRKPDASSAALEEVQSSWQRTLGAVQIETPDRATDVLANGWLMYQTLSARLWGRTGFYQSGGAFGFRDQLQDAMALVHAEPSRLRDQIVLAAAHQFRQGDVQHWWHPPSGRGVRTHFSDDYLWLPYAVCRYVNSLNDTGVLDEKVHFIEGRLLKPDEESYYDLPTRSEESASVYDHCVRAIENGLKFGTHGLPLIGCGDWNDGFNLIGEHGRGESVWLAFFLYEILVEFSEIARQRNDTAFVARCLNQAQLLRQNIEENAWDGEWYRRAYFDNGDPVGSHTNTECRIDSLPQSWSVITGAGDSERSRMAMRAVEQQLIRRDAGLIQLFDPPFDKSKDNPGYIKGYVPGVRENGGQYTHAAIWTVMAFAKLGEADLAWDLFSLLNPINHARTQAQAALYKVEPYVVAADVYAMSPHVGRGGWTWYTGSAGWMYRLVIESLLGLVLAGEQLRIQPHLPANWRGFKAHYRYRETMYHIAIEQVPDLANDAAQVTVDGHRIEGGTLPLIDDRKEHNVEIKVSNVPMPEVRHVENLEQPLAAAN